MQGVYGYNTLPCALSSPRCDSFAADVLAGGFDSITDEMMEGYKEPGRPRLMRAVWRTCCAESGPVWRVLNTSFGGVLVLLRIAMTFRE